MESENVVQEQPKVVGGKLFWSTAMDDCMLEVFLCHLAQGRRTPSGWKKTTTYNAIKAALMLNLQVDVSVSQIENRVKTFRSQTNAFKTLNSSSGSSSSGFGWDSDTMQFTADERVWNEALKANPNLKNYKTKVLPRFREWMDVLGDNSASGNIQKTVGTASVDAHVEESIGMTTQPNVDSFLNGGTINLDEDGETQQASISPTPQEPSKKSKLTQRKRKSLSSGLKEEMGNMRGTMETFVAVMKEKNCYEDLIWDRISDSIFSVEDMAEAAKVKSLEIFSGPHAENLKRFFLRVPAHLKKNWLIAKLKELNLLDYEHLEEGGDYEI